MINIFLFGVDRLNNQEARASISYHCLLIYTSLYSFHDQEHIAHSPLSKVRAVTAGCSAVRLMKQSSASTISALRL